MRFRLGRTAVIILAFWAPVSASLAQQKPADAKGVEFFESKVRPLLLEKCSACHGEKLQQSGLRWDSREAAYKGGRRGAPIVPGKPDESLLIRATSYDDPQLRMPPTGKLPDSDIAVLVAWVKMGAPWPTTLSSRAGSASDPQWAFHPVKKPAVPRVKNTKWCRSPIDHFILAKLESAGLKPAPTADKRTLIRRATFDLTGLPPTPGEIDAFLKDNSPEAFRKVTDRLLESPRYGERWGRHWLDCVRYADSNGLDENYHYANAFRYRDYVIDAFNRDLPYNRFIVEQIAGDLLPKTGDTDTDHRRLIATGLYVFGPKLIANPDKKRVLMEIIDEQIDVTSRAFMGLTVSCARCHDHKFDPITQRDYYALVGIVKTAKTMENFVDRKWSEIPLASPEAVERENKHKAIVAAKTKAMADAKKKKANETAIKQLEDELAELKKGAPPEVPYALAVTCDKPEDMPLLIRGNHERPSEVVPRRFPVVLAGEEQKTFGSETAGRLEYAQWLASAEHPTTTRVIANRLWQWHFGRGLVGTSDNFGKLGERPTHPELLDYLAGRFVDLGWSFKSMHRELMLSATYQMSGKCRVTSDEKSQQRHKRGRLSTLATRHSPLEVDPDNRLLWRFNCRPLEVEEIRDAMLTISGSLDATMFGSLLDVPNAVRVTDDDCVAPMQKAYRQPRRSVYLPVLRNTLHEMFQVFDFVDPTSVTTVRNETIVAPQALFMMNNAEAIEWSRKLAVKLLADAKSNDTARIALAYVNIFGRPPTAKETAKSLAFIADYAKLQAGDAQASRLKAWQSFCQALFCANEFTYVN